MSAAQANPIGGQQQGVANKIVAWSGVLEWQEVRETRTWCKHAAEEVYTSCICVFKSSSDLVKECYKICNKAMLGTD